ncbi:MAG: hypothetical protein KAR38_09875, partial [Calditrichia bacterium]|nr:hypothetical protein [Calditrichia bacterium]
MLLLILLTLIISSCDKGTNVVIPEMSSYKLEITLLPSEHKMDVRTEFQINNANSEKVFLPVYKKLKIDSVFINEKTMDFEIVSLDLINFSKSDDEFKSSTVFLSFMLLSGKHNCIMKYSLEQYQNIDNASFSNTEIANQISATISNDGVFLSPEVYWFPHTSSLNLYEIEVITPENWHAITSGSLISDSVKNGKRHLLFKTESLVDEPYIVAGEYVKQIQEVEGLPVQVGVFLRPADDLEKLMNTYLTFSKKYLKMYTELIGPYPYKQFFVVENFFETGYGMPGFTVLGPTVIRLPFIPFTSLGHEILHNWWGNGVFVDVEAGNWCEGLTAYMADHYYKKQRSEQAGQEYRYNICKDLSVYSQKKPVFALKDFRSRYDELSRAIGYGKAAMLFHYLHEVYGEDLFNKAMKLFYNNYKFKKASWKDIEKVFTEITGENQSDLFNRWINFADILQIQVNGMPKIVKNRETDSTEVVINIQHNNTLPNWKLKIPIQLIYENGDSEKRWASVENRENSIHLPVSREVEKVIIDPDNDLCRKLYPEEITISLSKFISEKNLFLVN